MQNTQGSSRQQILQTTEETWQQAHQGWVSLSEHTNHWLRSPSCWLFVHVSNSEHNTRCQSRAENETTVNPLHPRAAWHCSPRSKKGLKREHQHSQMWWAGETLPNCRHERPWQFSLVSKWHFSRLKTDGADFPYIQKKDFWTLTPNVQQMHERLGEYHHLVIQREKKKQSILAASAGEGRNTGSSSAVGAPTQL